MDEKLLSYIKQSQDQGKSPEEIKKELLAAGWTENLVNAGLKQVSSSQKTVIPNSSIPSKPSPARQETTKIKIVALWFVLVGLAGILLALGLLAGGILVLSQSSPDSPYLILQLIYFFVGASVFTFSALLLLKISSLIHKLETVGYQSAFIFLSAIAFGSLVTAPIFFFIERQLPTVIFGLFSFGINSLLLYLLRSEKQRFTAVTINQSPKIKTMAAVILLFLTIPLGIFLQVSAKTFEERQMKETLRELAEKEREKNPEPEVSAWESYTNLQFGFRINVPASWYRKEYLPDEYWQETRIAFGPTELPDYWYPDALYFWVTVFPTTDQYMYSMFQERLSKIGQGYFKKEDLGGVEGVGEVDNGSVAAEHKNYVYELHLHLTVDDELNYHRSEISEKILSSFKFTE